MHTEAVVNVLHAIAIGFIFILLFGNLFACFCEMIFYSAGAEKEISMNFSRVFVQQQLYLFKL